MPLDDRSEAAAARSRSRRRAELEPASTAGLLAQSRGRPAPRHLPRHLLLRLLAYQLQAASHGDLDPATRRYLDQVARPSHPVPEDPLPVSRARVPARPAPSWCGSGRWGLRHVMALEDGFAWNGTTYRSLSQVARAITGTRWNGAASSV